MLIEKLDLKNELLQSLTVDGEVDVQTAVEDKTPIN